MDASVRIARNPPELGTGASDGAPAPAVHPLAAVDVLRYAAQAAVQRSTLRRVAAEIGMSHSGLRTFIGGTAPYSATLTRLRAWHARQDGVTLERAQRALDILTGHLRGKEREAATRAILNALKVASKESREPPPPWLKPLRKLGR